MTTNLAPAATSGRFAPGEGFLAALERLHLAWDGSPTSPVLESWHRDRLEDIVQRAGTGSRFYRTRLATPRSAQDTWDSGFFTTKADLVQAGLDILSAPINEAAVYYETTGTTGPSTPCPRGPTDVAASNRTMIQAWEALLEEHFSDYRPTAAIMGPSELYAFGDSFSAVAQATGVGYVKLWPESPRVGFDRAVRLLRELQVGIVVCAPSMVLDLARELQARGLTPEDLCIRAFLVLGELSTPEFRANAESLWPDSVVLPGMYGSQESMCIAAGWPDGTLRVAEPNFIVEVLDNDTGRVHPDGVGELVLTMLTPGIKPLIRYRTGDLVDVGKHLPGDPPGRPITVLGRVKDEIIFPAGAVTPFRLEQAVLDRLSRCIGFQIEVSGDTDRVSHVLVRVAFVNDAAAAAAVAHLPAAEEELARLTGAPVDFFVVDSLSEETSQGAVISWKAARIVDRRG